MHHRPPLILPLSASLPSYCLAYYCSLPAFLLFSLLVFPACRPTCLLAYKWSGHGTYWLFDSPFSPCVVDSLKDHMNILRRKSRWSRRCTSVTPCRSASWTPNQSCPVEGRGGEERRPGLLLSASCGIESPTESRDLSSQLDLLLRMLLLQRRRNSALGLLGLDALTRQGYDLHQTDSPFFHERGEL